MRITEVFWVRSDSHRSAIWRTLTLLVFAVCATALRAQTIEFKLFDGRTGHPVRSITWLAPHRLHTGLGRESDLSLVLTTDKQGTVPLRFTRDNTEVNVPDCTGMHAAWEKVLKNGNKEYVKVFNQRYGNCMNFLVKKPVVRFVDSFSIGPIFGSNFRYVQCWNAFPSYFLTEEASEVGIVTTNGCGKITASPVPGQIILLVRPPTEREVWEQMN